MKRIYDAHEKCFVNWLFSWKNIASRHIDLTCREKTVEKVILFVLWLSLSSFECFCCCFWLLYCVSSVSLHIARAMFSSRIDALLSVFQIGFKLEQQKNHTEENKNLFTKRYQVILFPISSSSSCFYIYLCFFLSTIFHLEWNF